MIKVLSPWRTATVLISMLVIVPLAVVFFSFTHPTKEIWEHLIENVLWDLIKNTFILAVGVTFVTGILGVSLAWLTAVCEFPGRKILSWALLLPLAVPTYVLAFVFLGIFDFSGPIQGFLREIFGAGNFWFPDVRSAVGIIMVMSLALYPYVYLIVKNAFTTQGKRTLEVAQSLGYSRVEGFFKVAIPLARPWITGGLLLVIMETLADFGAVSIFNYDTFTTAIYKTWFGFFSLHGAAQLASILVFLIFIIIIIEQRMRAKMRFSQPGRNSVVQSRIYLKGANKWCATIFSFSVLIVAFLIPITQLLLWAFQVVKEEFNDRYFGFLFHSLLLGLISTLVTCFFALILSYTKRKHKDKVTRFIVRVSTLGYALPGTILAVGIFIPIAWFDNFLIQTFSTSGRPILQGTLFVMVLAYVIRFMAAGVNSIDNAMHRITHSIDEAANLMGLNGLKMLRLIHLPILKSGIITSVILVFVEVMKEMPITLMTRPFGWDTLAVKIYELTSEGEWVRASLPAVTLILTGLIPIIFLTKHTEK